MLIDYDDGEEDDGDCICGGHLVAPMIYLRLRQLLQMVTIMIMNDDTCDDDYDDWYDVDDDDDGDV